MQLLTALLVSVIISAPPGGGGRTARLPKGLAMEIMLQDTLDSRATREGQAVRARLSSPIVSGDTTVVAAGAPLLGRVTKVQGPQMGVMKAKIEFMFTQIMTPRAKIPITATVHLDISAMATKGGKMAGGMAAKEVAKRAIPVLGTVFLIQDVANAAKFVTEDKEIVIPAGTEMRITLDEDAAVPIVN